jgi:hypothetical protein
MTAGVAVAVLVLVAAATWVVLRVLDEEDPTTMAYAVSLAPEGAQRVLWTDWAGVREELGLDLDRASSGEQADGLLEAALDADLGSASILDLSAATMQQSLGFSPATLDWELYAQTADGAALVMRLGGGVTTDDVAAALVEVEYVEPAEADGTWTRDADTSPVATDLDPTLGNIALLEDEGLVVASDLPIGVDAALDAIADAESEPVPAGVVDALGSPLSAVLYTGDQACSELAMGNADPRDQQTADDLLAAAGTVNPLTGFAIAAEPGGGVRVAMGFDGEEQARTNADTRAVLAAGPAPGQGGDFADRFTVEEVSADGSVVRMDLARVDGAEVVADLTNGPVLFATC